MTSARSNSISWLESPGAGDTMTRARGDRLAGHDNRPPGRTFFPTTGIDRGGRAIRTFRRAALGAVAAGGSAAHLLPLGRAAGDATLQAVAADRWRTR